MLLLLETVIAFAAIMLLLSLLVKSLTSVVKNHVNYYADNLRTEVEHFLRSHFEERFTELQEEINNLLNNIPWRRLGEQYFSSGNIEELLKKITGEDVENLEPRLQKHRDNLKYAFGVRMKNLSLACGLGLCLLLNRDGWSFP